MIRQDLPHEAYVAAIACLDGVGPARLRWLLGLGPPQDVWERIGSGRLPGGPGGPAAVDADLRARWRRQASAISPAEVWQRCDAAGIGVVTLGGAGYPPSLAQDPEPPVVLFHRGDPDVLGGPRVAVIGTRRATGYGRRHAMLLGRELTSVGVSVVSGLALGIDAAAHTGAVQVDGAPPVAVVGGGLDVPCPRRNRDLAEQVAERGIVVSEVPPGVSAAPWRFPVRNRVIAALADAVVVVESAGAGGSMHTVREALARDRTVLAVPGPIDSRASEGTNQLISEGALVCAGVHDVLTAIGHVVLRSDAGQQRQQPADTRPAPVGDAATLLDEVGWRPVSAEHLALRSGLGFARIASALVQLETDGWVERNGGWIERVARPGPVPGSGGGAA
jgi:DNA processing protein